MFAISKYTSFITLSRVTGHFCKGEFGYSFHFNGQEIENNIKENIVTNNFGGRNCFDSIIGIFNSIDPAGSYTPEFSPYCFSGKNPILFLDFNGAFRMTKRMIRKYPELANMLMNMQSYINQDYHAKESFKEVTELNDKQLQEIFQWGKGPKVKVSNMVFWKALGIDADGLQPGRTIIISEQFLKSIKKEYIEPANYEMAVWKFFLVFMHESAHYGAKITCISDDISKINGEPNYFKERGWMLEAKLRLVTPDLAAAPFGSKFIPQYQNSFLNLNKLSIILGIPHSTDKPIESQNENSVKGDCHSDENINFND